MPKSKDLVELKLDMFLFWVIMSPSVLRLEEKVDDLSFNYKEWIQKKELIYLVQNLYFYKTELSFYLFLAKFI